jgi:hypothetical protein
MAERVLEARLVGDVEALAAKLQADLNEERRKMTLAKIAAMRQVRELYDSDRRFRRRYGRVRAVDAWRVMRMLGRRPCRAPSRALVVRRPVARRVVRRARARSPGRPEDEPPRPDVVPARAVAP